jgi:hypothetical protein
MEEQASVPQPQPPQPGSLGEFDRLVGVLFDPQPAFPHIVARPRWWVPLIILAVLAVGITFAYSERVGWEGFMRQQIEASSRTRDLSPEQKEQIIEQQVRFAPIFGYVFGVLGWPIIVLVVAGVFLFVFNVLLGTQLIYRQVLAVTSYSMLPQAVGGVLALVLLFIKDPADFDLQNPVASNIGAFLDPNTVPAWLVGLGASLDLFVFWSLLLLATGLAAAGRKLAWSKALTWVVATWVVWLVVKVGWVWIWS